MAISVPPTPAAPAPANSTTPTPSAPSVAPAPSPRANPFAEARKALGTNPSWEGVTFPGMATTDGEPDPAAPAATDPAAPPPAPTPPADDPAAEAPEYIQDAAGRWHRPDGTFADDTELAAITAQLATEAAAPDPAVDPAAPEAPAPITAKLRDRAGNLIEVEVPDDTIAQLINQNTNDGMRAREFREKSAKLDAQLERFNRLDTLIQTNPEAVVRESLTPQQRVSLATMLLAEHFDDLVPIIQQFDQQPTTRMQAVTESQLRMREQQATFSQQVALQESVAAAKATVAGMIPDTAAEEDAQAFFVDAGRDLQDAILRGERVDATTIPTLLAPRLARYGFSGAPSAAATPPTRPRITVPPSSAAATAAPTTAAPANAAAQQLAAAKANQTRLKLIQQQRRHAAAVPPAGAGAAPIRMPAVEPGADIKQASKTLKQLGGSWGAAT